MSRNDNRYNPNACNADCCGRCRHWHQSPIDPANIGAPRPGECRAMPPQVVAANVAQTARGPQVMGMISAYPMTQEEFPACGLFEGRLTLEVAD